MRFFARLRRLRFRRPLYIETAAVPAWVDQDIWGSSVQVFRDLDSHIGVRDVHRYPRGTILRNERTEELIVVLGQHDSECLIVRPLCADKRGPLWRTNDTAFVVGTLSVIDA